MKRLHVIFLWILLLTLLLTINCAKRSKVTKIGIVNIVASLDYAITGYKKGMESLGYKEGEQIKFIYEGAATSLENADERVRSLIKQDVDIIVTFGNMAGLSAAKLTKNTNIKIILGLSNRPDKLGIIDSFESPGGNVTGTHISGFVTATLDWFTRLDPGIKSLYVPHNPEDKSSVGMLAELQKACDAKGIALTIYEAITINEMRESLNNIPDDIDAILMLPVALILRIDKEYVQTAIDKKIPLASSTYDNVDIGALLSFGHDLDVCGLHAAKITQRVINGTEPKDIPLENVEFFLGLNLKTAREIDKKIPDVLLKRADKIVR